MAQYKLLEPEVLSSLDDLKYFRVLGELISFRKAAAMLGVSPQRVKRRIEALEARTGVLLFRRTHAGVMLTQEGEALFEELEEFWQSARLAEKTLAQTGQALRGEVIVAVTEGLGTFWLMPRLVEYLERNEHLSVFLQTSMSIGRPERGECDIGISLDKPTYPDLVVKRLGYLHVMPFASPLYIQKHGRPGSVEDILQHRIVEQISEQVRFEELEKYLGGRPEEGFAAIRTNTSAAHFWAVSKGVGIGVLPTYIRAITRKVEPIDVGFRMRRDIWISFGKDARRVNRVSTLIDFLTGCFEAKRFPWFGEEFIHPDDLEKHFTGANAEFQFEGFIEREDEASDQAQVH